MDEEDRKEPIVGKIDQHIDEYNLFVTVCLDSCVVAEVVIPLLWTTWCIRNKETIPSKLLDIPRKKG